MFASDLVRALAVEAYGSDSTSHLQHAWCTAYLSRDHRFTFSKRVAYERLNLRSYSDALGKGCAIIGQGRPAIQADMSGGVVARQIPDAGLTDNTARRFCARLGS